MSERRFNEEEVADIFRRATETQQQQSAPVPLASSEGMTLATLQEIGREVGIAPELIADAARSLALAPRTTTRRFLGLPIGVGVSVDLGRKLSDAEWDRLVVDLRETFDARGRLKQDGNFRQWTNGNLQALLEPFEDGHRLRLRTVKGDVRSLMMAGVGMLVAGATSVLVHVMRDGALEPGPLTRLAVVALVGVGVFAVAALQVPAWARLRLRQMQEVMRRLTGGS
jgi:hypothetical protein